MSFQALLWAMQSAPVKDPGEWSVLVAMAEVADDDGTASYQSRKTIGEMVRLDPKTVGKKQAEMERRGILARGDQRLVAHFPADKRPIVWDLQIPFDWFPDVEKTNQIRAAKGRRELSPDERPKITKTAEKRRRKDLGQARPERRKNAAQESGGTQSPVVTGGTQSPPGTESPMAGGLEVPSGGTSSPTNLSSKPVHKEQGPPVPPTGSSLSVVGGTSTTGDKSPARQTRRKPVTFMTEDWLPPREAADNLAAELGITRQHLAGWLDEFRDYWLGKGEGRADWVATWRHRMRTRAERGDSLGPRGVPGARSADPAAELLARERAARNGAHSAAHDVIRGEVVNG